MTAPRKRAPAKKSPKAAPAAGAEGPVGMDGAIRPVRIGARAAEPVEMVTVFSIDDVDYQAPAQPPVQLTIRFMREMGDVRIGQFAALQNFMLGLLGADAVHALETSPKVTREDVTDVFAIIRHLAFGAAKEMAKTAGNS